MNYIPILPYLVSEKRDQPSLNWRGTNSNVYDPTDVLMHSYRIIHNIRMLILRVDECWAM
jgi:hypothetical protein